MSSHFLSLSYWSLEVQHSAKEDLKKIVVALLKDGVGYKKIPKTLKLSCSTVAKTIQQFNRTGSTQNRPCHGRPKSAANIAAEVEGVGGQPVSAQTIRHTLHQIGPQGFHPRKKLLLKMMHKKTRKQFAEDKQTKDMDYWNHVQWPDETKINLFGSDGACVAGTRWGVQRQMCLDYSQAWWWECHGLGLHECCWHWGATVHWGNHECQHVLWQTEAEHDPLPLETGPQGIIPTW